MCGQSLEVKEVDDGKGELNWDAFSLKDELFYTANVNMKNVTSKFKGEEEIDFKLLKILKCLKELSPNKFTEKSYHIVTRLEFPRVWGLGTSSTLINNLANWCGVDPYELLDQTFGGAGFDIAAAQKKSPILYSLNEKRNISEVNFNPHFVNNLFFVALGKKQNSKKEINRFANIQKPLEETINRVSEISQLMILCKEFNEFQELVQEHEKIISSAIKMESLGKSDFLDFKGTVKSLGAWGGDLILATSDINKNYLKKYFNNKGLFDVIPYQDLIIQTRICKLSEN